MGNDISGLADPDYATAAAEHGAAVVVTHIRLAPRVADPDPHYDDVVQDVARFLSDRAAGPVAAGVPAERIVLDAGLDLGKTAEQSLTLLRALADPGRRSATPSCSPRPTRRSSARFSTWS